LGNSYLESERDMLDIQDRIDELLALAEKNGIDVSEEIRELRAKLAQLQVSPYQSPTALEQVQVARHPRRPYTLDYVSRVFTDWIELHGDRAYRDDAAIVGGWARLDSAPVMVIGHQKGRDMKENLRRNFGMPHPEGYRKALRLMRLAEKFGRPILTFIDTPGAYPGIGAEQRGQAEAIAVNLREMSRLRVPTVSIVIGEGGSGGALGIGVTDRILVLQNAVYSVISPEGCAAILWRSADFREQAAQALRLTARDLFHHGVADEVIPEPPGGAQADWDATADAVKAGLVRHLADIRSMDTQERRLNRWRKFEAIGAWHDARPS
jgi:acetyl-CoA carboxylase carboxyl transferase subunit alpha